MAAKKRASKGSSKSAKDLKPRKAASQSVKGGKLVKLNLPGPDTIGPPRR